MNSDNAASKNDIRTFKGQQQPVHLDLKRYYVFGLMPMLKFMSFIASVGLIIIAVYELCSGGTAG